MFLSVVSVWASQCSGSVVLQSEPLAQLQLPLGFGWPISMVGMHGPPMRMGAGRVQVTTQDQGLRVPPCPHQGSHPMKPQCTGLVTIWTAARSIRSKVRVSQGKCSLIIPAHPVAVHADTPNNLQSPKGVVGHSKEHSHTLHCTSAHKHHDILACGPPGPHHTPPSGSPCSHPQPLGISHLGYVALKGAQQQQCPTTN